jgi:hypothetical protein
VYAQVLAESISEGRDFRNGTYITQKMWNRTFEGEPFEGHLRSDPDCMTGRANNSALSGKTIRFHCFERNFLL